MFQDDSLIILQDNIGDNFSFTALRETTRSMRWNHFEVVRENAWATSVNFEYFGYRLIFVCLKENRKTEYSQTFFNSDCLLLFVQFPHGTLPWYFDVIYEKYIDRYKILFLTSSKLTWHIYTTRNIFSL